MKTVLFIIPILLGLLVSSCQKDDAVKSDDTKIETLEFKYQGVTYKTTYKQVGDDFIYDDKTVGDFYTQLQNNPTLSTLVYEDGSIELFDNLIEALGGEETKASYIDFEAPTTKAGSSRGGINMWTGMYMGGSVYGVDCAFVESDVEMLGGLQRKFYRLENTVVDKKVCSFMFEIYPSYSGAAWPSKYKLHLIFYDDLLGEGQTIAYQCNPTRGEITSYTLGTWNNRARSVAIIVTRLF